MKCDKCRQEANALINGRCHRCGGLRVCKTCGIGEYESRPTPNWMNRWVCNHCGKKVSR